MKEKNKKIRQEKSQINWHDFKNNLTVIKVALDIITRLLDEKNKHAPGLKTALNNAQKKVLALAKWADKHSSENRK